MRVPARPCDRAWRGRTLPRAWRPEEKTAVGALFAGPLHLEQGIAPRGSREAWETHAENHSLSKTGRAPQFPFDPYPKETNQAGEILDCLWRHLARASKAEGRCVAPAVSIGTCAGGVA
jgi:hypothetical protein